MIQMRKLISVLCLLVVTWSFVAAPVSGPSLVFVLPLIGFLFVAVVSLRFSKSADSDFIVLDPSRSSVSLRAPPRQ
jgi:hypothetical protein